MNLCLSAALLGILATLALACGSDAGGPATIATTESPGAVRPTATLMPTTPGAATLEPTVELAPTQTADVPNPATRPASSVTATPTHSIEQRASTEEGQQGLLRLADDLDDPQGYCVDVAGFGANIRLDAPLQAHTCKRDSDDQTFAVGEDGVIHLVAYDRCLAALGVASGAGVGVVECGAATESQRIRMGDDGRLELALPDWHALCVGVAAGSGEPAGGRNHLRRDLMLYGCDEADQNLITWTLAEP